MFDNMAMFELLARMEELFYLPLNSYSRQKEMELLAAEIADRVAFTSI